MNGSYGNMPRRYRVWFRGVIRMSLRSAYGTIDRYDETSVVLNAYDASDAIRQAELQYPQHRVVKVEPA